MQKRHHYIFSCIKRLGDIVISAILLLLLSPVLLICSILVLCNLGRPIFFKQERPGKNGKIFNLYKFRSMKTSASGENDADRLTPFGEKLRSSSADELPELFNVLKGDMSLVGPRPLLPQYLPLYNEAQARRHEVRPGITGLAQVSGRNAVDWQQRFALDVEYVDNRSLALDAKILLKTVQVVFAREGISSDTHITMEPFTGNEPAENKSTSDTSTN